MRFFIDKIYPYRWIITIISIVILFLTVLAEGVFLVFKKPQEIIKETIVEEQQELEEISMYQIDIKGAVKKPGVYSFEKGTTINDAITKAGGLKYNGTTKNINLSKKISNEMVLYIYTNSELEKKEPVVTSEECVCDTIDIRACTEDKSSMITNPTTTKEPEKETQDISLEEKNEKQDTSSENEKVENSTTDVKDPNLENKKVNINTAGKEELMTLKGIGEKTAEKIIAYRTENGKFAKIDDITNVSGIGASIFEKIKEKIIV